MGRRKKPETLMKEAVDERDIEKFAWACLEQARLDMAEPEEEKVFSTADTMSLVRQIVTLMKMKPPEPEKDDKKEKELRAWMSRDVGKEKTL